MCYGNINVIEGVLILYKKHGFTLLEIIMVIIVVGVLAGLALPRLFQTVEFSRSSEALMALNVVRSSMERCYVAAGSTYNPASSSCDLNSLDIDDPGTSPGSHFSYAVSNQSATGYIIEATRLTNDGGDGVSTIFITQSLSGATRAGTVNFVGIK